MKLRRAWRGNSLEDDRRLFICQHRLGDDDHILLDWAVECGDTTGSAYLIEERIKEIVEGREGIMDPSSTGYRDVDTYPTHPCSRSSQCT